MSEMLDDLELVVDPVIKDSILHKLAFVKLFHRENFAVSFGGELIHHCKRSFTNIANNIILVSATPVHTVVTLDCRGSQQSGRGVVKSIPGLRTMWHHHLPY